MRIVDGWKVCETLNEAGVLGPVVGVYLSEGAAEIGARGQGWWGGKGAIREVKLLEMPGRTYLLDAQFPYGLDPASLNTNLREERNRLVEAAKAKLTAEERKLLGIK